MQAAAQHAHAPPAQQYSIVSVKDVSLASWMPPAQRQPQPQQLPPQGQHPPPPTQQPEQQLAQVKLEPGEPVTAVSSTPPADTEAPAWPAPVRHEASPSPYIGAAAAALGPSAAWAVAPAAPPPPPPPRQGQGAECVPLIGPHLPALAAAYAELRQRLMVDPRRVYRDKTFGMLFNEIGLHLLRLAADVSRAAAVTDFARPWRLGQQGWGGRGAGWGRIRLGD